MILDPESEILKLEMTFLCGIIIDKLLPGIVQQNTYRVNGKVRRCHQDQVHSRSVEVPQNSPREPDVVIPHQKLHLLTPNLQMLVLRVRIQSLHQLILFQQMQMQRE
jgi:hypothetical protein